MSTYIWPRSVNFFLPHIQENYLTAETIIDFTDNALFVANADPAILSLYTFFHPLKVAYSTAYTVWSGLKSSNPSNTLGVTQLLDELSSTYARQWDVAIQTIYGIKTTQYKALMPNHRVPFQTGTIAKRVHALNNLITAIGTDASLAALKTNVTTFTGLLTTAMGKQSGQISGIDTAIVALDAAALAAAHGLFFVYGGLITKYSLTPTTIDNFYDVSMLHSVPQMTFNATLKVAKPKKICRRKMDTVSGSIRFTLVGGVDAYAYYTNGIVKTLAPGAAKILLLQNTISTHSFSEAGYTDINSHLYIVTTGAGIVTVKVEII